MSETIHDQVAEFHRVMGQPILTTPQIPPDERVRLRLRLIAEEFFELGDAFGLGGYACWADAKENVYDAIKYFSSNEDPTDIVAVADALGDIAYVVEGANLEFGIPGKTVLEEIHRANMTKAGPDGKAVFNEHGKVVKPPTYTPPDIARVLGV